MDSSHFYLVRHGETEWNLEGRMQGHLDSPLTSNGILQAKQIAQKLKDVSIDQVFSSDLLRAKKTAQIVKDDKKLIIKTHKLLRELDFGPFSGKKVKEFQKELAEEISYRETLPHEEQMVYQIHPFIETYEQTANRVLVFLREVAASFPGKKNLIVSHAGPIRSFLVKLGFGTNQELPHGAISNTCIVHIESDDRGFIVKDTQGVKKMSL